MIDLIRRQIELLKLLSKQREYKPASFFSKSLDVSTKTIYTDITYLQSEVEKYIIKSIESEKTESLSFLRNNYFLMEDEEIIKHFNMIIDQLKSNDILLLLIQRYYIQKPKSSF